MSRRQAKVTDAFALKKRTPNNNNSTPTKSALKRKVPLEESENKNNGVTNATRSPPVQMGMDGGVDSFLKAKSALHISRPSNIIAREKEMEEIYGWLDHHLKNRCGGAMYISGAPGTGKTAVVLNCIHRWMETNPMVKGRGAPCYQLLINCMSILSLKEVYEKMDKAMPTGKKNDEELSLKDKVERKIMSYSGTSKFLILVLDEVDQLIEGKGADILYSLFEWARAPGSRLILIGIANALDLTVRQLPLLNSPAAAQASPTVTRSRGKRCTSSTKKSETSQAKGPGTIKVMNFPPYSREDIQKILEDRLMEIGSNLFEVTAIKFVAAKIAATTGDMRKALDACKLALDAIEKQEREALRSTADDGFNFSSPKKFCAVKQKINVPTVAKVLAPAKDDGPLPLQQMIILATLLRIHKKAPFTPTPKIDGVTAAIPLSQMYDEYRKVCAMKSFSWMERSEMVSVCSMLQDRSLVTVLENLNASFSKGRKGTGSLNTTNKTGFLFNSAAVEKIIMSCDMKSLVSEC